MVKNISQPTEEESNDDLYKFKFSFLYLFLDFSLRWVVFGARRFHFMPEWLFWIIQAAAIPILVFYLADKRGSEVKEKYKIQNNNKVIPQDTTASIVAYLFVICLGTYIAYSLYPNWTYWLRVVFAVVTFPVYGLYILAVYLNSVQLEPLEGPVAVEEALSDEEWRDENDRVIVKLETDKVSLAQRVDAYTLESALFGALSFSGFVTIIASDKPILGGVQVLMADTAKLVAMILRFEFGNLSQFWGDMRGEYTLIATIAVQTLICSMFFLSVIISRLRFNDILKRVDYSTKLAGLYNEKEEEIINLTLQDSSASRKEAQEKRLQNLKTEISKSIYYAEQSMNDLVPIVMYMSVFRNLGIITFILILITGALWVSSLLAVIFTGLSILAYVFPFFDKWLRDRKVGNIVFFQRGRKFFPHLIRK
jgi:uncharacterized membrane protein YciS (DUF1049 family)